MVASNTRQIDAFEQVRSHLIGICYRMLGSVVDAEDVVQDAWLRWDRAGRPALETPQAWFTRVCTRLCLDRLKSAAVQRETYPGPWLPEPIVESRDDRLKLDESISFAMLMAVQRLSAAERAAFLLHDVFGYAFDEVADILDLTPVYCRQLASRARRRLGSDRPRFDSTAGEVRRLSEAFFSAIESGDLQKLQSVLAEDVVLTSDGGGKVVAAGRPIPGRDMVQRFLLGIYRKRPRDVRIERKEVWFNGAPGIVVTLDGRADSAYQLDIQGGVIRSIYVQRNPDKLRELARAMEPAGRA
jgi:RNA polymerase sigma-70 factor, ECF subfamily